MDEEQDFVCSLSLDENLAGSGGLADLWHQGALTDVTLVSAEGGRLPCHRVVLAAASPFFRALFSDNWDNSSSEVLLQGVAAPVLRTLLSAVYTRKLVAPPSQLPALLTGAMQLALQPLAAACEQQLLDKLSPSNALGVASLASALGVWPLERDAEAFAAQHFVDVLREDAEGVAALPVDRLERLLSAESLMLVEESDALDMLLEWASCSEAQPSAGAVMHNVPSEQERLRELPRLLRRVRLCLVPRNELSSRARGHPACVASPEARGMLERAAQESTRSGAGYSGQPRSAVPLRLLAIGGHDSEWRPLRSCEVYDTRTDTWQAAGMLPQTSTSSFVSAVAGHSASGTRELLAIGGSTFACSALGAGVPPPAALLTDDCPDSASSMLLQWSPRGSPTARQHAALACVDAFQMPSFAYLIGGRAGAGAVELSVVERTILGAGAEWTPCPSLSSPRASGAAATLQDVVYVAGGQSGRQTLGTCEVLHAGSHEWVCLPSAVLCQPRKYLSLITLRGCLYAVGGMRETRARLDSVERLDPRDGRWRTVAPMHYRRSSAGVVAAAGALWASGGYDGERYHCSVERYDDRMDAWTLMAPMATQRSGAAMVAI
jgi:hypothetical protein